MKVPREICYRTFGVILVLGVARPLQAWFGFGHFRVAVEIKTLRPDLNVDPDYSMVPDSFESTLHTGWFDDEVDSGIPVDFTWSHGVQRVDGNLASPPAPTYPNDGRFPGIVMYELAVNKINYANPEEMSDAIATAIGDLVHNAADHVVHWEYFRGGEGSTIGPNLWVRNHCTKEEWASYVLLMVLDAEVITAVDPGIDGQIGTDDDHEFIPPEELEKVFDATGNIKWQQIYGGRPQFGGFASTGQMDFKADPSIIHLAMKAHRKNRRNSDTNGSSEFQVHSVAEIANTINATYNEAGREFKNEVLRMNLSRWNVLDFKSRTREFLDTECGLPDWPGTWELFPNTSGTLALEPSMPSSVIAKFQLCVQRGIAWLENQAQ